MSITYWIELFKFMEMIDELASMVNMIYRVVYEIQVYLCLFCLLIGGFGSAFFIIGRNQIEFDGFTPEYG